MSEIDKVPTHYLIPENGSILGCKSHIDPVKLLPIVAKKLAISADELQNEIEDETFFLLMKQKDLKLTASEINKVMLTRHFDLAAAAFTTALDFRRMTLIINNDMPTESLEAIDPAYVAWALEYFQHHDANHELVFTDEVAEYIALCFHEDGFTKMPAVLKDFQDELDTLNTQDPQEATESDNTQRVLDYATEMKKLVLG